MLYQYDIDISRLHFILNSASAGIMNPRSSLRRGLRRTRSHLKTANPSHDTSNIQPIVKWPEKLRDLIASACSRQVDEKAIIAFLEKEKWPIGLAHGLMKHVKKVPLRFFLVDDSGMNDKLLDIV